MRDSKVIDIARMTVSPDGNTMTVLDNDKSHDRTNHWVAEKQ